MNNPLRRKNIDCEDYSRKLSSVCQCGCYPSWVSQHVWAGKSGVDSQQESRLLINIPFPVHHLYAIKLKLNFTYDTMVGNTIMINTIKYLIRFHFGIKSETSPIFALCSSLAGVCNITIAKHNRMPWLETPWKFPGLPGFGLGRVVLAKIFFAVLPVQSF